jgi:hypothetical protein
VTSTKPTENQEGSNMNRLEAILMVLFTPYASSTVTRVRQRSRAERGSVTIEHVLWSVAVIAIVAIVVAAVKAYVTSQAGLIN